MASDFVEALCAKCHVPPEPVTKPDSEGRFACPTCGESDTAENILREVKQHVVELASRNLQEQARGIARGSKFIKFEGDPIPKGEYRFISNMKA